MIDTTKHNAMAVTINAKGETVATVYDTVERLAEAHKLDLFEVLWAIEYEGQCDVEGPWPGQTTTITTVD
jgi:hypothetical protein